MPQLGSGKDQIASDTLDLKHREASKPYKNMLPINITQGEKKKKGKFLPGKSFMLKEKKKKKKKVINNEEN